jgi:peroxidase
MNHTLRNRQASRKARAVRRRSRPPCLEPLEERCQPSVTGFSPVDEVGNNAANQNLGTAGTDLLRLSPPDYKPVANGGDGLTTPSLTYGAPTFVAGPRLVSNTVSNQATTLFGPTDINTVDQNGLSDFGYTWGQFIDHDMDLTPTQSTGAPAPNKDGINGFPIPVDPVHTNDPIHVPGQPDVNLAFTRSIFDTATGNFDGIPGNADDVPRQQLNVSTSFLDLSQVYGSTTFVSDALRTRSDGLLKSSPGRDNILGNADDLLPFNTTAPLSYNGGQPYFTQAQLDAFGMANDAHLVSSDQLFAAGDPRANETTELTSLQTLFMRNHNAIARQLATLNPALFGFTNWTDDNLFQEARKLNIAIEQNIIYTGYLPALLGPTALPAYSGYNPDPTPGGSGDPSISTEFSTVGFRFGHSLLNNTVARDANDGSSVGDIGLAISFFNPTLLTPGGVDFFGNSATDIGAVLKGDADNNAQALDVMAVSSIRNLLFGQGGQGEDLIARDIWRADDHGIGTYNQVRVAFGLAPLTDTGESAPGEVPFRFHGFEQISSDPAVVQKLITAFTGPSRDTVPGFLSTGHFAGDINPFIAGLAEDHVPGSDLGPLFHAILVDQFMRLRSGDRFFYLNESFSAAEQAILNQGSTLGKVITANTGVTNLQADVFRFLAQEDGKGKGFYTTTSGQAALTGSPTGTKLTGSLFDSLVAALANPDQPGRLVLVDANGNYLSRNFLKTYSNVQSYLQTTDGSMAFKLSLQLLTAEINVALGKVDPTTSIFVPAVTVSGQTISSTLQNSLMTNGVSNPSGIANIQAILDAAIAQLRSGSSDSTFMEALKDCLDGINSNEAIFILR